MPNLNIDVETGTLRIFPMMRDDMGITVEFYRRKTEVETLVVPSLFRVVHPVTHLKDLLALSDIFILIPDA